MNLYLPLPLALGNHPQVSLAQKQYVSAKGMLLKTLNKFVSSEDILFLVKESSIFDSKQFAMRATSQRLLFESLVCQKLVKLLMFLRTDNGSALMAANDPDLFNFIHVELKDRDLDYKNLSIK